MDVEDDPSSPLSTPTRQRGSKGEEEGDVDENSKELNQLVIDYLPADGLSAANPIMKQLSSFPTDRYTEGEYTMTTLMVSLARHLQELTVTVQNLTRTISDPKPEGAPTGETTRQPSEPTAKSYAKGAAQAPKTPPTQPLPKEKERQTWDPHHQSNKQLK